VDADAAAAAVAAAAPAVAAAWYAALASSVDVTVRERRGDSIGVAERRLRCAADTLPRPPRPTPAPMMMPGGAAAEGGPTADSE
jgi:hypothetical protein